MNSRRKPARLAGLSTDKPFPVVGIGASAGGLEAVSELLRYVPDDTGMAFVFIQHLDRTHPSMLSDLLSRATRMPVREASSGMAVEPDHVYVIPPNVSMSVAQKTLKLKPRPENPGQQHMSIDYFLCSLAEDQKSGAIGVILSGTGSDGTLGLQSIKAEGGITLVEDERSAKYDSMPHNAIAAGCADFVVSPEGIARELLRIGRHPYVIYPQSSVSGEVISRDEPEVSKIFAVLRTDTGADFAHYRQTTINRRIQRRMLLHKIERLKDYISYLRHHPAEVKALYQDFLIHVTSFFRNPETFEALTSVVFPSIMKNRSPEVPVRIWVPGCSSGEETYSLAIALLEFLGDKGTNTPVQLFGTDLSETGIEKARAGFYPESIQANVSKERLSRFFTKLEKGYRITKTIRDMCVFARQNIFGDPPFSQMDLISCRNLLIYMEPVLQKKVIAVLHYALKRTGFLLLGNSEGVGPFTNLFAVADKKHKIYSRKWTGTRPHMDLPFSDYPKKGEAALTGKRDDLEVQREFERILLLNYAPASVVVNEEMEIIQSRGEVSRYVKLAPGKPTLNLLKMAREGLLFDLRSAINQATKSGVGVRKENVQITHDKQHRNINFEVKPLKVPSSKASQFMIVFEDVPPAIAAERDTKAGRERPGKREQRFTSLRTAELEQELAATKEYLHSVIEEQEGSNEELQSANEEILSSNEELQSTNEELETAKEELQSANEELNTVNDELRSRNLELTHLGSDLVNLIGTINIPIVMVGGDLRIRRFTPVAEKALRVIPADTGRSITDIKLNIDVPDLEELLLEVMNSLSVKEREVQDQEGHWYLLQVRPYRTTENKIDGAVLALIDIDQLKRSREQFKKSSEFAEQIIDTVREPLLVLDPELRVRMANQSFYGAFQVRPAETVNQVLYSLGNGQWNIPALRALLEDVLPQHKEVREFEVEYDFPQIGVRTMLLNARQIEERQVILLAIADISERKRTEKVLRAAERQVAAGRMAATVSHEINNPLESIVSLVYLLNAHPALDERTRVLVKQVDAELQRVVHITKHTLGMFKPSDRLTAVKISEVLEGVLELFESKIKFQEIEVEKRYELDWEISAVATEIRQVFTNLISNAISAMEERGRLKLHVYGSRDWHNPGRRGVRIVVADAGTGISPENRQRIFEPFFTTKEEKGTGLGLWVTQGIVNKYGGTVRLHSSVRPGRSGTCFAVFFPDDTLQAKKRASKTAAAPVPTEALSS